ncbi:uncharacterized protein LOC115096804 [Rhinatrema bivittatum]|uniref:uncharacterized protein LOC115096804 n=1 Tax=Rhinatrema bivittatum TaxID=194408 RepID=UPI00112D1B20|nr:uncharacterized protein LOC115096804 [Rhinatrema bivittatum]
MLMGLPIPILQHRNFLTGKHSLISRPPTYKSLIPIMISPFTQTLGLALFSLILFNAQSLSKKTLILNDILLDKNPDFCAITETWLKHTDTALINQLPIQTYDIFSIPRKKKRGGGILLAAKKELKITQCPINSPSKIETGLFKSDSLQILLIYAPPGLLESDASPILELTTTYLNLEHPAIILGDFNLHVDDPILSTNCESFLTAMSAIGFKQIINKPTHRAGHTLDLIFVNSNISQSTTPKCQPVPWSDHTVISSAFSLEQISKKPVPQPEFIYRKSCTSEELHNHLGPELPLIDTSSPNSALHSWSKITETAANNLCPLATKKLDHNTSKRQPWFKEELQKLKHSLRQKESKWQKTPTQTSLSAYKLALHQYKRDQQSVIMIKEFEKSLEGTEAKHPKAKIKTQAARVLTSTPKASDYRASQEED